MLFDLQKDPYEITDIFENNKELASEMEEMLETIIDSGTTRGNLLPIY